MGGDIFENTEKNVMPNGVKEKSDEIIISIDRELLHEAGFYDFDFIDYLPLEKAYDLIGRVGLDLTKRYVITFKDKDETSKNIEKLLKEMIKQNNKDILEKEYCEKIKKLEEIKKIDNEPYHGACDNLLIELLEKLGYKELVKLYKEAQKSFWYA